MFLAEQYLDRKLKGRARPGAGTKTERVMIDGEEVRFFTFPDGSCARHDVRSGEVNVTWLPGWETPIEDVAPRELRDG